MKTVVRKFIVLFSLFALPFTSLVAAEAEFSYIAPKASQALFLDITKSENNRILAVGERGIILFSDDEGESWTQAKVPTRVTLNSVYFHSKTVAFAAGHDALILKSDDTGETWNIVNSAPELEQALFDITFFDESNGIAVGSYGAYFYTEDGGDTWLDQIVENLEDPDFGFPHFYSLDLHDGVVTMVGEVGFIAQSSDGGMSWEKLSSPYAGSLFAVQTNRFGQYIMGLRGNILLKQEDTWRSISVPGTSNLNGMAVNENGSVFAFGMDGVMVWFNSATDFENRQRSNRKAISAAVGTKDGFVIAGEDGLHKIRALTAPLTNK